MTDPLVSVLSTRTAYVAFTLLLCTGIYMMIANENLVKKIIGVNLFQTALFLFFIASAFVRGGSSPIIPPKSEALVVSPLPHGVSLTAVGLALCLRIHDEYGTLRAGALRETMREQGDLPEGGDLRD
jgi:multicomponent Na+:H+ antiporter subunit C